MTLALFLIGLVLGYWIGGSNPARVVAFVAWIKTKPWKGS